MYGSFFEEPVICMVNFVEDFVSLTVLLLNNIHS